MAFLKRPRSIVFWLRWLVIVGVLPAWAATAWTIAVSYERERATLERSTIDTARALVQVVERDIASAEAALKVLAASPYLASGDLAAFHRQASEALPAQAGNGIVLADAAGQQLISTIKPYGEPLPRSGVPDLLRIVVESGAPSVSDFYIGSTSGQPQVAIGVPVLRDGKVAYVLTMGILPARLGNLLRSQSLPPDWIAAVFDSKGTIVARTRAAEQFVGQKGVPALLRRLAEAPDGVVEGPTLEGIPALISFSRSTISGWAVAIGIPIAGLTTPLYRSLWLSVVGACALFMVGLVLARLISLRIARSIGAMSAPALALASDAPIVVPPVEITEVGEVGKALAKAARLLEERKVAREQAERAERDMAVAKQAAERSNQAKSQFLTMMSHELRTPLNGILGFAQLIDGKFYGPLTAKQKEFVDAILSSGNHLLELINDILELSKIEGGRLTVSLERVDLLPLVKSVVATLEQSAEKAGIDLKAGDFGRRMPAVHADRVRMAQSLLNLGTNAIKYNRPGGTVTFAYSRESGMVRISVSDTGIGIPENRQAELFEPFNRLGAEQRAIEGTGVGLALTRRLVELMGGKLGFASTLGKGSRFWIDMPVHVASPQELDPTVLSVVPQAREISGVSVLYVEDNPSNLVLMRNLLATMDDVRLIEATNGAAGLAMAKEHRPDLIILDINLADINGVTLLRQLKDVPELAATPILALSAHAMPRDIERGIAAGFFEYLTKPLDVGKFLKTVAAAIQSVRRNRAADLAPPMAIGAPRSDP